MPPESGQVVQARVLGWDAGADAEYGLARSDLPAVTTVTGALVVNRVEALGYTQFVVDGRNVDPDTIVLVASGALDEFMNPNHGPDGRFAPAPGGGGAATLDPDELNSRFAEVPIDRESMTDFGEQTIQYEAEVDGRMSYGAYQTDAALNAIAAHNGMDGTPTVASKEEVDAIVADGGVAMQRGFNNTRQRDQFVHGEYEAGTGLAGSGYYTQAGDDPRIAREYDTLGDGPTRMVLRPDARIADANVLARLALDDSGSISDPLARDPGRLAALGGFQAYRKTRTDGDFIIVVDRGALVIDGSSIGGGR